MARFLPSMYSSRIKVGTDPVETNESNSTGADDFSNQSNESIKVARKPVERRPDAQVVEVEGSRISATRATASGSMGFQVPLAIQARPCALP